MICGINCFVTKTEVLIFSDLCSNDSDFFERILSIVSLFYLLFHVHVVVVHQGNCWEEVGLYRQRPGSQMF